MTNPMQSHTNPHTGETFPHAAVLVMAASRRGVDDPVARLQDKSHKCLVEIDGQVMLERVLEALVDSGCFATIHVSVDSEDILRATPKMNAWVDEGRVVYIPSRGNLADSVLYAVEQMPDPLPLIITTGDNALHTPELLQDFMRQFWATSEDGAVAFSSEEVVLRDYANSGLAFHQLKDGGYSSCNLYALRNQRSLKGVKVFESGGQFGKRHMRILKAFGLVPFVLYKLKLSDMRGLVASIGRRLGVTIAPIMLDYSYGPIDVDHKHSFDLTEATLVKRREAAGK
jgi:GTP:adenosylcobinamide-phosphate guanylyltransferase